MRRIILALAAMLVAAPAFAQEPVGCDKFKWPLDKERALLAAPVPVKSGDTVTQADKAMRVTLFPEGDVKLPMTPSRAAQNVDSFAGFVRMPAPKAGIYKITMSAGGWIDVTQDGKGVKSVASNGVTGCEGLRKSVKFDLAALPYSIQVIGVRSPMISIVVTPD